MINYKWFKYFVEESFIEKGLYKEFDEHEASMGRYDVDQSYESQAEFEKKYFINDYFGRMKDYYDFCLRNIPKDAKVLSIGSGRAVLESVLSKTGYNITASDLEIPLSFKKLSKLYPTLKYEKINAFEIENHKDTFCCILLLSVSSLWTNEELSEIIQQLKKNLRYSGVIIFDSQGSSPNNLISNLLIEILPRYEAFILSKILTIKHRKRFFVSRRHHGYRRSDNIVKMLFHEAGFELVEDISCYGELDYYRTIFINRLSKYNLIRNFLKFIGRYSAYNRLYLFQLKDPKKK